MTEPTAPNIPADAPQDVKDFFDCKGTTLLWHPGEVTWLGLGANLSVTFEHGSVPGSINIVVSALGGMVSFTLPASVNAAGELVVDTSAVPDLSAMGLGGRPDVDAAIKRINDWFMHNGKKLRPATLNRGVVTLEKTAIGVLPPPAGVVPGAGGGTEPVKPTTPAPPPPAPPATGTPPQNEPGGWCSLLGMLMLLLFLGVMALGGGIGFVFLGGQPPEPAPTAVALASSPPTPSPSAAQTQTSLPTPTPTLSPTATPAPTANPTPSPTVAPSPSPSAASGLITQVCVRVVHQQLGNFFSYLDWFLWWAGEDVEYFEIVVLGANNDEVERLVSPSLGYFRGQLGLMQPGDKQIVSLIAHLTDGSTIDLTQDLIDEFGSEEFTVRFPQEDSFGCAD